MQYTNEQKERMQIEYEEWKKRCGNDVKMMASLDSHPDYVSIYWTTPSTKSGHIYTVEFVFHATYFLGAEPWAYLISRDGVRFNSRQVNHLHIYKDGRLSEHPTGWNRYDTTLKYASAIFHNYLHRLDQYLDFGRFW